MLYTSYTETDLSTHTDTQNITLVSQRVNFVTNWKLDLMHNTTRV